MYSSSKNSFEENTNNKYCVILFFFRIMFLIVNSFNFVHRAVDEKPSKSNMGLSESNFFSKRVF